LARVANALSAADLGTSFQVANVSNGWQYFVVSFTPSRVSRDRVEKLIQDAGGRVFERPPLGATSGPRTTIWARVSSCACAGDPYTRVSRDLATAHLDVDLELGPATKDWLTFSATLDPAATKASDVTAILEKDGATLLDQPPGDTP
jgi:hypothetical protein